MGLSKNNHFGYFLSNKILPLWLLTSVTNSVKIATMTNLPNRIHEIRKAKGLTLKGLGDLVGTSGIQIKRLEEGERRLTTDWMERISKALGCRPADLLINNSTTNNTVEIQENLPLIPVIGSVQAGVFQPALQEDGDWERIPFPTPGGYNPEDFYILKVRGDSMDQVYPEGYNLVCVKLMAYHGALTHGKRVIVHRRDQYSDQFEATVKELHHDTENKRWLLMPRSHNPQYRPISIPNGNGDELDFAGSDDLKISGVVYTGFMPEPGF